MKNAIDFYTRILDFKLKYTEASANDWVVGLINDAAELQLTVFESDSLFGSVVNVWVDDVDGLFDKYLERGSRCLKQKGFSCTPETAGPDMGYKRILCYGR